MEKIVLKQYVRKNRKYNKGQKIGLFVAIPLDEFVGIGWSKSHTQLDEYNDILAHDIAIGRAISMTSIDEVPDSFVNEFENFLERCQKYYKDKEFPQLDGV